MREFDQLAMALLHLQGYFLVMARIRADLDDEELSPAQRAYEMRRAVACHHIVTYLGRAIEDLYGVPGVAQRALEDLTANLGQFARHTDQAREMVGLAYILLGALTVEPGQPLQTPA